MVIDKTSWHARLYLWYQQKRFYDWSSDEQTIRAILCPYVRTVLIWAPLRLLLYQKKSLWTAWPALALTLEYGLWRAFGHGLFLVELAVLMVLLSAAAIIGLIGGVVWLTLKTKNADPVRSFGRVLAARYAAAHERICPVVEIK
jgi:hypothetical protein